MTAGAAQKTEWEKKLNSLGCRRCHVIGAVGNPFAVNLDQSAQKKSPEELARAIKNPAKAMPDFRLDDSTTDEVVTALLAASLKSTPNLKPAAQLVHFDQTRVNKVDVISRKCGSCHKVLTRRNGLLGKGDAAPNLSGLFSPFYPAKEPWNAERLDRWLQNPRKARSSAAMQPVGISGKELIELKKLLE